LATTVTALLDTGCEQTGISNRVVNALSLPRIGSTPLSGTTGGMTVPTYSVDIDFSPGGLVKTFSTVQVFEIQGSIGVDMVIGRDIICHGTAASQLRLGPGGSGTFDL
jgi:hypothetical protein